jgi:hypothetical protein
MTLGRLVWLLAVAVMVLIVNVLISFLYMVVYSYVIDPGHDEQYYQSHVQFAAPYSSIVAGIPLMFLAGWWVSGWWESNLAIKAGLTVWLVYALIDLGVLLAARTTARVALLFVISIATKLLAAYFGSLFGGRHA